MLLSFLKPQHSHILLQREVSIFATSMVGARPRATCPPRPRRVTCPICHKSFLRKTSLTVHVETVHENIKSFTCHFCNRSYGQKSALNEHLKTVHKSGIAFTCPICHQTFQQKNYLTLHLRTDHKNENESACPICYKSFQNKSYVTLHVKTVHENLKSFTCHICDRSFGQKSTLKAHGKRVHEKVKPFSCKYCSKSFGHKGHLNVHVKTLHRREAKMMAEKEKDALTRGVHENVQTFTCTICNQSFGQNLSLKKHLKKVHKRGPEILDDKNDMTESTTTKTTSTTDFNPAIQVTGINIPSSSSSTSTQLAMGGPSAKLKDIAEEAQPDVILSPTSVSVDQQENEVEVSSLPQSTIKAMYPDIQDDTRADSTVSNKCVENVEQTYMVKRERADEVLELSDNSEDEVIHCTSCGATFESYKLLSVHQTDHFRSAAEKAKRKREVILSSEDDDDLVIEYLLKRAKALRKRKRRSEEERRRQKKKDNEISKTNENQVVIKCPESNCNLKFDSKDLFARHYQKEHIEHRKKF